MVDAVTAAVAVHRASLEQQHYHGTLDWLQDEQNTDAAAGSSASRNPRTLAAHGSDGLLRGKTRGRDHVPAGGSSSSTHSDGHSIPSTKSEHSAGEAYRDTDLDVASWAVLQTDRARQQTDSAASANQPKLTEQLLQDASLSRTGMDVTAAWVAAAAAVTACRQGSMVPAASLEPQDSLGAFGAAAAAEASSGVPFRGSLEHAGDLLELSDHRWLRQAAPFSMAHL